MKKIRCLLIFLCSITISWAQTGNHKEGVEALNDVTTGKFNTAVADSTLYNLKQASAITSLGYRTGYSIGEFTTAQRTTIIGFNTGSNISKVSDNTIIGYAAAYFNGFNNFSSRGDHTIIGSAAGFNMLRIADDNTFIGEMAGFGVVSGDDNTYIGYRSGAGEELSFGSSIPKITEPTFNTTTGIVNSPHKSNMGLNSLTARDNTGIGATTMEYVTSGYRNTAIGNRAGRDIREGFYNTFVGDSTGTDSGSASYNTFVGQGAGAATEYMRENTFIGYRAGWDNNRTNNRLTSGTQSSSNTYLGYRTGHKNREGSFNLIIGARGDFDDTSSNEYTIGLGYNVLVDNRYSMAIGAYAKAETSSFRPAIAIGYNAEALLQQTMVLGGATATDRVTVGIGTKAPNIKSSLDLADTDKGFLINRLTNTQKTPVTNNLTTADLGMSIYNTDDKILQTWNGTSWTNATSSALESRIAALESKATVSSLDKTPLLFNYQTALLDLNQKPLTNTNVSFRINILKDSSTGNSVYQETHSAITSTKGLINFKIGNGTLITGDFSTVNWASAIYFLKVELDVAGGTNYQDFGTSQLVSVPYVMHAKTADKLNNATASKMFHKIATPLKKENQRTIQELREKIIQLKVVAKQLLIRLETK